MWITAWLTHACTEARVLVIRRVTLVPARLDTQARTATEVSEQHEQ